MGLTGTVLPGPAIQDAFDVAAVTLGIAVFVLARSKLLTTAQKLHLALVFQVAVAFAIALTEFWLGFPIEFVSTSPLIPAECAWIIAFPLIVPNTPRRMLVSSLLAASMGPAALALSATINGFAIERPWLYAAYFLSTNYVCAFFAYPVSLIVYRFGKRLKHAREIGSYEMLDRIGEGGMGQVWRARHRLLARPAAIKLIRTELLGSSAGLVNDTIRRFEREAQETAKLGSVHTIDVYDYGVTEDGDFYYVMELLNGISLERYVKQFGPMPPGRVVYLLRQVCHSLSEAHERGLIHRDIKPANIFMCRLGPDDDFVKVLDFGLVKQFGDRGAGTMPTIEELTAGTPAFMAPEIALERYAHRRPRRHLRAGLRRLLPAHRRNRVPQRFRNRGHAGARQGSAVAAGRPFEVRRSRKTRHADSGVPRQRQGVQAAFRGRSRQAAGGVSADSHVERERGPPVVAGAPARRDGASGEWRTRSLPRRRRAGDAGRVWISDARALIDAR